jgi:hypothetical protein
VEHKQRLQAFVAWWRQHIQGDEKGEAQTFVSELMKAFGHAGALEAGGRLETRVRRKRSGRASVAFADYVLPGKVLIEMKKRGENLGKHYDQLEEYWKNLENKPRYALLCNFDDIWIYDFPTQFYDPVDRIRIEDLPERAAALEFLIPGSTKTPVFQNNLVDVTKNAAYSLSQVFLSLVNRQAERRVAQRFTLQCMLALFAEDIGLLPEATFTRVVETCLRDEESSYDLFTQLFSYMNTPGVKLGRRFPGVDYFDGGIFKEIYPLQLTPQELELLRAAARENWSKIRPAIFGTIFEDSLTDKERHQIGAHFTSEQDIKRIVDPVIVQPWDERIEAAHTGQELRALHSALCDYQVLDPACGSGNFLYIAYLEMKKLESRILERLLEIEGPPPFEPTPEPEKPRVSARSLVMGVAPEELVERVEPVRKPLVEQLVSSKQFWGFDINEFAVELAKVTLMIAKKVAVDRYHSPESPLPLDDLDDHIRAVDALFEPWPAFDACIGNPPYMGAKRLKQEHPPEYINRVRDAFPDVPGNADYCVYWFRKAHELMKPGARAGLVGTNTIRQNYSRIGGLDYIVDNGGHIYDAVSSMPWSGEAAVHVSIACWSKGEPPVKTARLHLYDGESNGEIQLKTLELPSINSSLSQKTDVSGALALECNIEPKRVFQGQTPGHKGFVLSPSEAAELLRRDPASKQVFFPYLTGDDLIGELGGKPSRFIIDFEQRDILEGQRFREAFRHIERLVLPDKKARAEEEIRKNQEVLAKNPKGKVNTDHQDALAQWWLHFRSRVDRKEAMQGLTRYIACSRVTKRPIFDFVSPEICPSDALQTFAFEDDYSFGILQSGIHWLWFIEKASTLKSDFRYTPDSVFDTFPWPQNPTPAQVNAVADAGRALHEFRRARMARNGRLTLRDLYRSLEQPGKNPLKDLHAALDAAVMGAYGFDPHPPTPSPLRKEGEKGGDVLALLLRLNEQVAERIERGEAVTAPGIPAGYPTPEALVSAGCIEPPELI